MLTYDMITDDKSAQSNLTKRLHHRSTWTVQSYSPDGANVHPSNTLPWAYASPYPKQHLNRFSCFYTAHCRRSNL